MVVVIGIRVFVSIALFSAVVSCSDIGPSADGDNDYWQRQMDLAKDELQRGDLTLEERGRALIRMARAYSALGHELEAVEIWGSLLADESADLVGRARSAYRLAYLHDQHGRWDKAIVFYRKYARLHSDTTAEQKSRFDENTENPASLLFHVGEIQEYKLEESSDANDSYLVALRYAEETDNLNLTDLKRLYGNFLLRQGRIEEALAEYKDVTSADNNGDWPPSTVSTTARIGMIECLCLLGRCEEAHLAFQPLAERWAGSEYEARTGFVKQGEELLAQHCSE